VLRKQVFWLIHEKGLPQELEMVVRDLWELRVRGFHGLKRAVDGEGGGEDESGTGGELTMYSSQESAGDSAASSRSTTRTRVGEWKSSPGGRWNMPKLMDTLGLCYLGCVLLRLPLRMGDIYGWAKNNEILYLGAVSLGISPTAMLSRLTKGARSSKYPSKCETDCPGHITEHCWRGLRHSREASCTKRCCI